MVKKSNTWTCKICGRPFSGQQALAAHMATHKQEEENKQNGAIPQPQELAAPGGVETGEGQSGAIDPGPELTEVPQEDDSTAETGSPFMDTEDADDMAEPPPEQPSETQEAEAYARQGYSLGEMINVLGFNKSTARNAIAKVVRPESEPQDASRNGNGAVPLYRNVGSGQQMLNPEPMLEQYLNQDGDRGAWMYKGMMLLRAAQLMNFDTVNQMKVMAEANAKEMEPMLKLLQQSREEMDASSERVKKSQNDIAEEAAGRTADHVVSYLNERDAQRPHQEPSEKKESPPDTMAGVRSRMINTMWDRMMGMFFPSQGGQGGQSGQPPQGWTRRKESSSE